MARRKDTTAQPAEINNATDHVDFDDPVTDNHHEGGGEVQDPDAEPESHADHHQDDGSDEEPAGANHDATAEVLDGEHEGIEGAEPEKEYDPTAAEQDTDNTHQDGNNGLHQEDYVDADTAADLGRQEAQEFDPADDDTSLHPGDIGRRQNLRNEGAVHATMAPANRDETIVGEHPETEKGLRPLAPLDGVNRTDDAGRPFDGDTLHTVEKGLPVGQGVIEHIHAPTATGAAPEGIMSTRAPVPVSGVQRDPRRLQVRQGLVHDGVYGLTLTDTHHALLDHAEDMRVKGADTFTAPQVGAQERTADELVEAGLLAKAPAMGGGFFPNASSIYRLT
jgi:hypothetical protein